VVHWVRSPTVEFGLESFPQSERIVEFVPPFQRIPADILNTVGWTLTPMYRILLPVEPDDEANIRLAEVISEMPLEPAEVEIFLLSVFEDRDIQDLDGGRISSEAIFEWSEMPEAVEQLSSYLQERGFTVEEGRTLGEPAREILEMANEKNAQRIVMGGRKRTPVGKVLFGGVTQSVILESKTPVTIVMDE
jgi:nucleotide-binding universal stress UspA family protein